MRRPSSIPSLGRNMSQIRKARDLTRQELARAVGLSDVMIYHYENGDSEPKATSLYLIAWHLEVPMSAFYDPDIDRSIYRHLARRGPVFNSAGVFGARDGVR